MKVYVINLKHRIDRRDHIISEFKKQGIRDYEFWTGLAGDPSFSYISKSHKMIVQNAKDNGLESCCISEDDCAFTSPDSFQYFIDNIPESFDLYLSSIYWGHIDKDNIVTDFSSLTFYIIHSRYYDTFLSTPEIGHVDRSQSGRGKFVVCNPFTTYQIPGFSDNVGRDIDYTNEYLHHRTFLGLSPLCSGK